MCALLHPQMKSLSQPVQQHSLLLDGLKSAFGKNEELRETIAKLEFSLEQYEKEVTRLRKVIESYDGNQTTKD